ncbi:MAG: PhnD/SsuA/transferrin family substrate-binding protein [Reichenbachiella sp.]|uniref:phosphate/phosphite/phosphonate ABC transporter substrate-binding protein n=1 Tax=Reichenbachiella sp. TaxID=2184521 RepID=UPI003265A6F4
MIISKIKNSIHLLAIVLLMACSNQKEPLQLATYTYATNDRIAHLEPLAEELKKSLDRPVEITSYPDVEAFVAGIKANKIDVALINTLGYLILSLDNEHMLPVATLKVKTDALDNYKTVLLSNKQISSTDFVKANSDSLSFMFVAPGSTSGHLIPRLYLSALGLHQPEDQFKSVTYGGNHTSTLERLLAGESDLCAIGSNEYFKQIKADSLLLTKTNLLWISDEIPLGPVLLNKRMSDSEKEKITTLLLDLHQVNAEALSSIKDGWSEAKQAEKFYAITDDYYDDFRSLNGQNTRLSEILNLFTIK